MQEHIRTFENGLTFKVKDWYSGKKKTLQVVKTTYYAGRHTYAHAAIYAEDSRGKVYYTLNIGYLGCRQFWAPENGRGHPVYF